MVIFVSQSASFLRENGDRLPIRHPYRWRFVKKHWLWVHKLRALIPSNVIGVVCGVLWVRGARMNDKKVEKFAALLVKKTYSTLDELGATYHQHAQKLSRDLLSQLKPHSNWWKNDG